MLSKYDIMGSVAEDRSGYRLIVGDRVMLPPHTDAWMRGARYGKIVAIKDGRTPRAGDYLVTVLPDAMRQRVTSEARDYVRVG